MIYHHWNDYLQEFVEYPEFKWWMLEKWRWLGYRRQKTQQERRRWQRDIDDGIIPRRRRAPRYLNRWTDLEKYPTCYDMRSWKKLHKKKKQWM